MIRTVDTDVIVLAVNAMSQLQLEEMWILFGVGKKTWFIPSHELCTTLGPSKCIVLPLFHSITGCDQSSSFAGRSMGCMEHLRGAYLISTKCLSLSICRTSSVHHTNVGKICHFNVWSRYFFCFCERCKKRTICKGKKNDQINLKIHFNLKICHYQKIRHFFKKNFFLTGSIAAMICTIIRNFCSNFRAFTIKPTILPKISSTITPFIGA